MNLYENYRNSRRSSQEVEDHIENVLKAFSKDLNSSLLQALMDNHRKLQQQQELKELQMKYQILQKGYAELQKRYIEAAARLKAVETIKSSIEFKIK